ncbi:MAG: BMC domain-containing protein [Veillonellales bacterium]
MSGALGLIQVEALSAAYAAADAALKAADVTIVGLERVKGGGLMLLKITGDVASVQAAVDSGLLIARAVGKNAVGHVIARTALPIIPVKTETEESKKEQEEPKKSLTTKGDATNVECARNGRNKRPNSSN